MRKKDDKSLDLDVQDDGEMNLNIFGVKYDMQIHFSIILYIQIQ
jgi:hypothetical protein